MVVQTRPYGAIVPRCLAAAWTTSVGAGLNHGSPHNTGAVGKPALPEPDPPTAIGAQGVGGAAGQAEGPPGPARGGRPHSRAQRQGGFTGRAGGKWPMVVQTRPYGAIVPRCLAAAWTTSVGAGLNHGSPHNTGAVGKPALPEPDPPTAIGAQGFAANPPHPPSPPPSSLPLPQPFWGRGPGGGGGCRQTRPHEPTSLNANAWTRAAARHP